MNMPRPSRWRNNIMMKYRTFAMITIIGVILVLGSLGAQTAQAICYVNGAATGANSGANWTDAYTSLQNALGNGACAEIWVAKGVYKPTTDPADRGASFDLRSNLGIYGGFAGTESTRDARDWTTNVTILSGDIDNNDSQTPVITDFQTVTGNTTNSFHVVNGSDATNVVIDGLTITGGCANSGPGAYGTSGGGIRFISLYGEPLTLTLTNLIVSGNYANNYGGGLLTWHAATTMNNVAFESNSANWYGGGFYQIANITPSRLTDVTFTGNSAYYGAGAYDYFGASTVYTHVTFRDNFTRGHDGVNPTIGGGLMVDQSAPILNKVVFTGNRATWGGGLALIETDMETDRVVVQNALFSGNRATGFGTVAGWGGGILINKSKPSLINVRVLGNIADTTGSYASGGGIAIQNSNDLGATFTNVLISGNVAKQGGGFYASYTPNIEFTNVTVTGNQASQFAGGVAVTWESSLQMRNGIISNNLSTGNPVYNHQLYVFTNSSMSISDSLIQDGCRDGGTCTNVLETDPLFVTPADPHTAPTIAGDLHLQATSPAANYGDNSSLPADTFDLDDDGNTTEPIPIDLDGNPRISNSHVDLGAYEYQSLNTAPVIAQGPSVAVTMSEDGSPTPFSLTLNATDVDGDALTWSLSSGPANGAATVSGTGASPTITYAPTTNWNGADSFVAQVSDGNGGIDEITVNVTVNPVNDAPVMTEGASVAVVMSEDGSSTPFSLTLNATDSDGDTLTWIISAPAAHGTASIVSGDTMSYAPEVDYNGADSFVVQVGDGNGGVDTITVNVTIEAVNDAPVITGQAALSTNEDMALTIALGDLTVTDVDNTYPTGFTLTVQSGANYTVSGATITPAANFNGTLTVPVVVHDGAADSAPYNLSVTVNAVNDAPVNTTAPGMTGAPLVGNTLTANPGAWNDDLDTDVNGASTIAYAYQWQRADDAGGTNLADIAGATSASYTLTDDNESRAVRVRVTATDTGVGTPVSQSATADSGWMIVGTAEFTISKASAAVSESETTDTFTVVLTAQPGSDVVFTVSASDATEATVSPATLTFTTANWSTAQTVAVTGVNDTEQDGSQTSLVTISVNDALSDDAFDALADKTVTVTTADNDVFQAGQWQDANKDGPDDDDMCWAAAAANLLAWGGWDAGFATPQAVFNVFEDHWTNDMSRMYEAWRWWLDGTVPGSRAPGSKVDVGGAGGSYQGAYSSAFFVSSMTGAADLLFNTISTALTHAFGVTLGLLNTASADTHALTVWGYDLDDSGALLGLHVADSDDGLSQLQYVGVQYDAANSYWTLSSDPTWYIRELNALGTRGGATNAVFGGSGTITGQRYGAGGVKSLDYSDGEQTPVPEPGSLLLVSLGLLGLLGLFRGLRRR